MTEQVRLVGGVNSGWNLGQEALESRLKEGIERHKLTTIHCETCLAEKIDARQCLPFAAKFGQAPGEMFFYDGADLHHPINTFDVLPAQAFFNTTPFIPPHGNWNLDCANSSFAAAFYGSKHLKIDNFVVMGSSSNVTAQRIVDYFEGSTQRAHAADGYIHPFLHLAEPIIHDVRLAAKTLGKSQDIHVLYKLASLALVSHNTFNLRELVGANVKVVGGYVDEDRQQLQSINPDASLMELFKPPASRVMDLAAPRALPQHPIAMCCSCCDSRANGSHLFNAKPSELLSSNSISVLLPPHNSIVNGHAHATWAEIEGALHSGVKNFIFLGHSDCGGIKALINIAHHKQTTQMTSNHLGPFLGAWLHQAGPVVERALAFADNNHLSEIARLELVTKEVKKWSARNASEFLGKHADVVAYYLRVDSRNVERLDPYATIEQTYAKMTGAAKAIYLHETEAPANTRCVPSQCPPAAYGPRKSQPRKQALIWLLAA